jgi:hypothetical protein
MYRVPSLDKDVARGQERFVVEIIQQRQRHLDLVLEGIWKDEVATDPKYRRRQPGMTGLSI